MIFKKKALCGLLAGVIGLSFGIGAGAVNVEGESSDYLSNAASAVKRNIENSVVYIVEREVLEEGITVAEYCSSVIYRELALSDGFFVHENDTDFFWVCSEGSTEWQRSAVVSFCDEIEEPVVYICKTDMVEIDEEVRRLIRDIIIIPEPPFEPVYPSSTLMELVSASISVSVFDSTVNDLVAYSEYFN